MDENAWRPSVKLAALLAGKTAWADADDAIRSMARLPIHNAAVMIRDEPSRPRRAAMLSAVSPSSSCASRSGAWAPSFARTHAR